MFTLPNPVRVRRSSCSQHGLKVLCDFHPYLTLRTLHKHGRFQLFSIAVPAVSAVLIPAIPAVPAVPIPESTAVLCDSDAVPIPVWNCIELQCIFLWFSEVFAVPAIPVRVLTHA